MSHYESWQRHCTKVPELLSKYCSASMRCAVVSIVIALAFAPQAFGVLRPLFPVKPEPPFSGEATVIRDDLVRKTNSAVVDRASDRARDKSGLQQPFPAPWNGGCDERVGAHCLSDGAIRSQIVGSAAGTPSQTAGKKPPQKPE
jgi:hypothetical protein